MARRRITPAASSPLSREPISVRLLSWFDAHRRVLPWRHNRDPYSIWIAEVMLQQTRVDTVVPYFERFLTSFPDVVTLAAASEQDVLRHWEGLGYYRRARDLHAAARRIVAHHAGVFPRSVEAVGELPGFGQYTRNAVLSQAFDLRLPILEANSQRVLSRLHGLRDDPRTGPARKRLWSLAESLLPEERSGDFNQGLMELGSLVCTPTAPGCDRCPLRADCQAYASGRPEEYPVRVPKPTPTAVSELALVIRREGRLLLVQRPPTAIRWANLWEFPHAEREASDEMMLALARELVGLEVRPGPVLKVIRHGVTRFRITLTAHEVAWIAGEFASSFYTSGLWLTPAELADHPVSAPQRRLAKAVLA